MNVVLPTVYLVISAIGIVGNSLVILVLRKITLKSITDILVQNLAAADLMFAMFLPFWAVEKYEQGILLQINPWWALNDWKVDENLGMWRFGSFMCQFISFIFLLNLYASVYFLTALSVDRYYSVCFPIHSRKVRNGTVGLLIGSISIWDRLSDTKITNIPRM